MLFLVLVSGDRDRRLRRLLGENIGENGGGVFEVDVADFAEVGLASLAVATEESNTADAAAAFEKEGSCRQSQ